MRSPFVRHLGASLDAASSGRASSSLRLTPELLPQNGFAPAGIIATPADRTAGVAAKPTTTMAAGCSASSSRSTSCDRRRAPRCVSTVLRAGKTLAVVESEVYACASVGEKLCAKATVTLALT